jgi:hypothetical protein
MNVMEGHGSSCGSEFIRDEGVQSAQLYRLESFRE